MLHIPKIDPATHPAALEQRLKRIDRRRAQIEAQLTALGDTNSFRSRPDSPQCVELEAELRDLLRSRRDVDWLLHPPPKPVRSPELQRAYDQQREADKEFLRNEIKNQTDQAESAAQKLEAAGEHRQARLQRSLIPELPEQICREFAKDPALLAELDE